MVCCPVSKCPASKSRPTAAIRCLMPCPSVSAVLLLFFCFAPESLLEIYGNLLRKWRIKVMRNKRLILALTEAVLYELVGVMLVTRYLASVQAYTRDLNNVVVAKSEIPLGAKITAEQLALTPMPNGSAPEGAFRKVEEVVGRVAITAIGVREAITNLKLAPEGIGAGLSAVIPEGYRAMTVKVDDVVGVSGFIMPGSVVDVVSIIVPLAQHTVEWMGLQIFRIVLEKSNVLSRGAK